jgi:alpha-glucuronidase
MATTERRLVDNFWDLRDDAHDHPERWEGVTAEAVLQRLAEVVEEAEEREEQIDWWRDVAKRMIDWRGGKC